MEKLIAIPFRDLEEKDVFVNMNNILKVQEVTSDSCMIFLSSGEHIYVGRDIREVVHILNAEARS